MVVMSEPNAGDDPDAVTEPDAGPEPPAVTPADQPLLPSRSSDETDVGWGERPEPDDDDRLRQDRPPHWDTP